jgi:hypothetical protein
MVGKLVVGMVALQHLDKAGVLGVHMVWNLDTHI